MPFADSASSANDRPIDGPPSQALNVLLRILNERRFGPAATSDSDGGSAGNGAWQPVGGATIPLISAIATGNPGGDDSQCVAMMSHGIDGDVLAKRHFALILGREAPLRTTVCAVRRGCPKTAKMLSAPQRRQPTKRLGGQRWALFAIVPDPFRCSAAAAATNPV